MVDFLQQHHEAGTGAFLVVLVFGDGVMKNWKLILAILALDATLMSAGYCMLIPFLPVYLLQELKVDPAEAKLWSGAIFSITFFIGGFMAPFWGKLADKNGKKPMLLRSGIGLALSYFLGGIVTTPLQLFLVRMLQGFAAGLISVFLAMVSSSVPKEKLGFSMGIFQSGLTIGNVMGPLLGGTLATFFGMRASFFVAGGFLIFITALTWFLVPEPQKEVKAGQAIEKTEGLLKRPQIRDTLMYVFMTFMMILLVQPILSLYVAELLKGEGNIVFWSGAVFSIVGIACAIAAPLWGRWGQRVGFVKVLAICAFFASFASTACSVPKTFIGFCGINFVYGIFFAGISPSLSSLLASNTTVDERGRVFGYMFSAQQYGSMLGPLLGGIFVTLFPMHCIFYLTGSLLMLLSMIVYFKHRKDGSF